MIDALAQGCTWEEAADRVGVTDRTLYRWCAADLELAAKASQAREAADDLVQAVTFANCCDSDPAHNTLRMFWLKNRRKDVFGDKIQANINADVNIKIRYIQAIPSPQPTSAETEGR